MHSSERLACRKGIKERQHAQHNITHTEFVLQLRNQSSRRHPPEQNTRPKPNGADTAILLPTPSLMLYCTCITTAGSDLKGIHAAQSEHVASIVIILEGWTVLVRPVTNLGTARFLLLAGNPTDKISETAVAAAAATTNNLPTVSCLGIMALPATGKMLLLQRGGVAVSSGNGDGFLDGVAATPPPPRSLFSISSGGFESDVGRKRPHRI